MIIIIVLSLLTLFIYLWLQKFLSGQLLNEDAKLAQSKKELAGLIVDQNSIQSDNARLKFALEETLELYEMTKEIAKFLEAEKVFATFNEKINKFLDLEDCKFLPRDADLSGYNDYTVLALNLDKKPIGYLAVLGIRDRDTEKFNILTQQFMLGIRRAVLYHEVQEMATLDSLTHVFSRRYWFQRCNEEINRSKKFNYSLACFMLDIDHFKDFNDKYGHLIGDALLIETSKTIRENIRQIDLVGKYGGEEFCVVLTETDIEGAQFVAQRIRKAMEEKCVRAYDEELRVTISIGISVFPKDAQDLSILVDKADQALYRAKETGRNRVCVYSS